MKQEVDLNFKGKVTFYPEVFFHLQTQIIDDFEISPVVCAEIDKGHQYWDVCEPHEADMWSVYVHIKEGGRQCIADCENEITAEQLAKILDLVTTHFKNTSPDTIYITNN